MKHPKSQAARLAASAGLALGITLAVVPVAALAEEPGVAETEAAEDSSASSFTAVVNGQSYSSLGDAVDNAQENDVIVLSGVLQGDASNPISVTKSVTFMGASSQSGYGASLNDVVFNVEESACISLDSLELTGKSKIHDTNASGIAIKNSHVSVNVLTSTANAPENSFIYGTNENNGQHVVKFTLENNVFEQTSADGYGFIFDWAVWADGSSVTGNTFGTEDKKINTWLFRAMNFAKDAVVTISDNTGYLADGSGAFSLVQNTTAANEATVVFSDNEITHSGTYKHFIWFDGAQADGSASVKMVVTDSNCYNGGSVGQSDVWATNRKYGYLVTNAVLDGEGKILSGNVKLGSITASSLKNDLAGDVEYNSETGEVSFDKVATVNGRAYPSLTAAVNDAKNGDAIALFKDTTESITIPEGLDVTLDLAGHKLTSETSHTITNNGTLTIKDSSENKTGVVDCKAHQKAALYNGVGGVMTVEGGSFTRSAEASTQTGTGNNSYYVVKNFGTMTINDGTFKFSDTNQGYYSSLVANGWYSKNDSGNEQDYGNHVASLTINGGTLTGGKIVVKNDDYSKLSVTGGSLNQPCKDYYALVNYHEAEISGGTIHSAGKAVTNQVLGVESDIAKLTISGGTITSETNFAVETARQGSTSADGLTTITGGTFKGGAEAIRVGEGCSFDISGGTFDSAEGKGTFAGEGGASVSGGAFSAPVPARFRASGLVNLCGSDGDYTLVDASSAEAAANAKVTTSDGEVVYFASADAAKEYAESLGSDEGAEVETIPHYVAPTRYAVGVEPSGRGTASVSSSWAPAGTRVTVALSPAEGFRAAGVTAIDASGKVVEVEAGDAAGEYAFTMPASGVTVTPLFARSFPDVDYASWYAPSVDLVSARGVMNGVGDTGRFGVGATLTRAELAALLWNCAEPGHAHDPAAENATGMDDVADGQWYTAAANWAVESGVINGYDNADGSRSFGPNDPVTLEQLCAVVRNLAGGEGSADLSGFLDSDEVSGWARPSVSWAVSVGLVNGSVEDGGLYLRAGQRMARERVAAVVANALGAGVLR